MVGGIVSKFQDMPIARRLPLAICGLAGAAVAAAGGVAGIAASSAFKESAANQLNAGLDAAHTELSRYFGAIEEDLKIMGASPEVAAALRAYDAGYGEFGAGAKARLQELYISANPNPAGEKEKLLNAQVRMFLKDLAAA